MKMVKHLTRSDLAFINPLRAVMFGCIVLNHVGDTVAVMLPPGPLRFALLSLAPNGRYLFVTIAVILIARAVSSTTLARRLLLIVVPFVAWSVISLLVEAATGAVPSETAAELAWRLASGSAAPHLYFVLVTVQLTIGAPLVRAISRIPRRFVVPTLVVAALAQVATAVLDDQGGLAQALIYKSVIGYPLYIVGAALVAPRLRPVADGLVRWVPATMGLSGLAAVAFVVAAYSSASNLLDPTGAVVTLALRQVWVVSISLLLVTACVFAARPEARTAVLASRLGKRMQDLGYGLFLAHMLVRDIVASTVAGAAAAFGFEGALVVMWIGTVVGTVVLVTALRWTPLSWLLTGRPMRRRRPPHADRVGAAVAPVDVADRTQLLTPRSRSAVRRAVGGR
jgi:hypothetical protein